MLGDMLIGDLLIDAVVLNPTRVTNDLFERAVEFKYRVGVKISYKRAQEKAAQLGQVSSVAINKKNLEFPTLVGCSVL